MYAKNCLAFLATFWFSLQSIPVAADEIINLDPKQLNERNLAASSDSGSCQAPSASTSPTIASVVTPSSTTGICPLASALCAACPGTTTTITVSNCPSTSASASPISTSSSSTCESGCGKGATTSISTTAGESSTGSNPSSSRPASSSPISSSPIQTTPTSTPLVPSTRTSTPLIPSGRTSTPAESGSTLQTVPTSTAASPGPGASTPAGGGAVTPRAAIPPGIVRRQLGVMNVTAPFANTSSILTNATSTFNMTSFRTTSTIEGFRFHMRNRY
ncbi:hypothetical protein N7493_010571 [Penicillium malachiteum]|uniref:Uncharacterized protein n=1 Tax=Penicillium malachiteum TaxID=1324776 RepID=A0AAD6MRL4_9EURO|nr:hypothetical protein N7493_010571 [Penicillium malachiteum]